MTQLTVAQGLQSSAITEKAEEFQRSEAANSAHAAASSY
jgi:hypothetical protein